MPEVPVCKHGEMAESSVRIVASGGREVGVFLHNSEYYAYHNLCPHQGGPVCEGLTIPKVQAVISPDKTAHGNTYDDNEMHFVCPWHGYEYNMKTGECAGDASIRLHRHKIIERDGYIYVSI
jgi:nitrite reductase/ring-hydroxylating ferredoxin subunit